MDEILERMPLARNRAVEGESVRVESGAERDAVRSGMGRGLL